ncbi:MAG: hypothetical protein EBR27_13415 [Betaproteobacteria bacterium]|nr:hypothetical protein [Betaproteobacteria bacterium]
MKTQLIVLVTTLKSKWPLYLSMVSAFFMPIYGLLFLVGFSIFVDTITGIWKAKKLKQPITSRRLSAVISKMLLYEITVILFYLIDKFILNDIILTFFSVPLMLTKVLSLILVSIEVVSINENYKAVKGIDLWQSAKNLISRAKELKKDADEIRHN